MIISKTPYRISLFGGSTDYESFYSKHGSLLVGFALDKYSYIMVRNNPYIFDYISKISYSKIETVSNNKDIQHNGVRGVLEYFNLLDERLEISCLSDLPAQTGIGSSSTFIVGLINALKYKYKYSTKELANYAIKIEREHLNEIGGIQDQIWAAYGGFNSISIDTLGDFSVRPLPISENFINEFIDHSFLIYTGNQRQSFQIATAHDTGSDDKNKLDIFRLAHDGYDAFCRENISEIGSLLRESWESKKRISSLISASKTDELMDSLSQLGMIGGKLIGSGGSGFIFGITKNKEDKLQIQKNFFTNFIDLNVSKAGSIIINE